MGLWTPGYLPVKAKSVGAPKSKTCIFLTTTHDLNRAIDFTQEILKLPVRRSSCHDFPFWCCPPNFDLDHNHSLPYPARRDS